MMRPIRLSTLLCGLLVLTHTTISKDISDFMQGFLIAAGIGVGIVGGTLIYDTFFKELTDLEELLATEELYHAIHQEHMKIIVRFNEELTIVSSHNTRDNQINALKQTVYKIKKGARYPFLEYVKTVDTTLTHFDAQEKKVLKQRTSLLKRKLALLQAAHTEETTFLATELGTWIEELSILQKQLAASCDKIVTIKSYVTASEEYKQESLLARLDYLENRLQAFSLRPSTHVVYINAVNQSNHQNRTS